MATQFLESEDRRLETFLQTVGARANPHGHGRSLYDHLKGTRDVGCCIPRKRCWTGASGVEAGRRQLLVSGTR